MLTGWVCLSAAFEQCPLSMVILTSVMTASCFGFSPNVQRYQVCLISICALQHASFRLVMTTAVHCCYAAATSCLQAGVG